VKAEAADAGDGGDVAERNPDLIQREIEQTRAELADTIDAIADRISPRRAASRGAHAVKHSVSSVLNGHASNGQAPAAVIDAPPTAAGHAHEAGRHRAVRSIAGGDGGSVWTGTGSYAVSRRLRTDRVLLAVGAVAAVAGAVIVWRSRD
jgi:hypothetical protein